MKILGIDPGIGICGFGLVENDQALDFGVVTTVIGAPLPARLKELFDGLTEIELVIVVLVVALLIGYLAMTQMGSLGFGKTGMQQEQTQQNVIEQAQNVVDAINNRLQQTDLEP